MTWLRRLAETGQGAHESANERHGRHLLVFGATLMSAGGVVWGVLAVVLGVGPAAAIPLGYVVVSIVNLGVLARTLNVPRARVCQVLASLMLPFLFQWSLGGFVNSGGVMLWAMIALVGSLTFSSAAESVVWLIVYCALTIFSGVIDPYTVSPIEPSANVVRVFFVLNITFISSTVFGLVITIHARQRSAIDGLEAAERRMRELTASLEAQVRSRTAELEGALVRAEAGTRAKDEFLAVISHEIRTPLNGIIGTTGLLAQSAVNADQRAQVGLIQRSGELLLTIINDVLDYSKIEAGRLELSPRTFDLAREIDGVVGLHRPHAEDHGVELEVHYKEGVPRLVHADPDRLAQVIGNLVGNAVKFTSEGRIDVTVSAREQGERFQLEVSVTDTGIGIDPSAIGRLFQPFMQADSTTTRRFGGTGLGLAICARLVERMGGQISVESRPGVGTTFRVVVLVGAVSPTDAPPEVDLRPVGDEGHGLRVLLAEDNPINQTIGVRLLRHLGCSVEVAGNGLEALELIKARPFDLVLMDVQMPVLDGLGATRAIRALSCGQPRIVALTANAFERDRTACLTAGMDSFLTKPLNVEALRRELLETVAFTKQVQRDVPAVAV